MAEPKLLELAAEIAEYMVSNELSALDSLTFEDTNGDIRYIPVAQERFNERYTYILDLLEETFDGKVLRIQEQQHGGCYDKS